MKNYLFLEDIILLAQDLMMHISLKYLNSNGCNHLTKNQEMSQKMLNLKLELQHQEQITPVVIIKAEFMFLEDMVELDIKELHLMIFIIMMLKHQNGQK
jgi:hypothetical protein